MRGDDNQQEGESHVLQIGKHPHVSVLSVDFDLRLVRMNQSSHDYTFENRPIGWFESTSLRCFQSIDRPRGQRKVKELFNSLCHSVLGNLQFNDLVQKV